VRISLGLLLVGWFAGNVCAQSIAPPTRGREERLQQRQRAQAEIRLREQVRQMTARGAQYLLAAQEKSGGWMTKAGPGITALVLQALVQEPTVGPEHPAVRRGIAWVLAQRQPDGGIYRAGGPAPRITRAASC
jgi:hypothetical protein